MQKIIDNLQKAEKKIQNANHLIYMTYPIVKNQKLIPKILSEIKESILATISAILQYEYLLQNIELEDDSKSNFQIFIKKCAPKYSIAYSELLQTKKIIQLAQDHSASSMTVSKNDSIILLSKNMKKSTIALEDTKNFLQIARRIFKKSQERIRKV